MTSIELGKERLLTRKESDIESLSQPQFNSNNRRQIDSSELKFCISWCLITSAVLTIVTLIMLFWLHTLQRATMIEDSFTASMFNLGIYHTPVILAWTKFFDGPLIQQFQPSKQCPYKCIFSDDRDKYEKTARIRIFHARDLSVLDLPLTYANSLNVFYSMESPINTEYKWNLIAELALRKDYFNLTITYQQDSQIVYPYDVFEPRSLEDTTKDYYTDEEVDQAINNKTELAVIVVSNCITDSKREVLIEQLRNMMPLTVAGKCYENKCDDECLSNLERQHSFYFAFENSVCPDYISEKFWRLKRLIVPVVLSRSVIPSYIPSYTYIAVDDFATLPEFVHYLFRVAKDRELYKSYFAWTKNYKKTSRVQELLDPGCELCKIAYQKKAYKLRDIKKYIAHNQCKHAYSSYLLTNRQNSTWELT